MLLRRIWRRASHDFRLYVLRDRYLQEVRRWTKENGDGNLRFNYPLDTTCTVWDVGGFKGDFASVMYERFGCEIMVFEPLPSSFSALRQRFTSNPKVRLYPYGLGSKSGTFEMYELADGTSFYPRATQNRVVAKIRAVSEVISETAIEDIALIKINIEGGEYDLLPALIEDGIRRFRFIQVQFHNFVPGAVAKRNAIREALAATHKQMWCYDFVWESWERKR